MKALSIRLENYLMDLLNKEARMAHVTKVEVIKTALINYFLNRQDMIDLAIIESRRNEKEIPFEEVFKS